VERVVFPVRALALAGVRQFVITNAAGGINTQFASGTLMVIDDHLNLTGQNPLVGPNDPGLGRRFPDMTEVYARRLRRIADESAQSAGISVEHGVYLGVLGPSYETPAEIRAFRALGADAVGMSTVVEAITARHMGAEVLGLSCIANMAAGIEDVVLTEEDVLATSSRVQDDFCRLLEGILGRL
jgi:purine-nucleoside phosphorylase